MASTFGDQPWLMFFALLLATLVTRTIADSNPLCEKVMSGNFDFGLISITFDWKHNLDLYTSHNIRYYVNDEKLTENSLDLSHESAAHINTYYKEFFDGWIPKGEQIKAHYHFMVHKSDGRLVVTDQKEYMLNWEEQTEKKHFWNTPLREDYAIVHDWLMDSKSVYGHMINKDTYDGTGDFVIYQLWLKGDNLKLASYMDKGPPTNPNPKRHFYYIERTDQPDVINFVHRSSRNKNKGIPAAQMFSRLPHGFLFNGRMYLFDDTLGCVHIIQDMNRVDLKKEFDKGNRNITKKRVNVPYENFFICPENYPKQDKLKSLNASRCETTDKVSLISDDPGSGSETNAYVKLIIWVGIGFVIIIVIVVSALMVLKFCFGGTGNAASNAKTTPKKTPKTDNNSSFAAPSEVSSSAEDILGNKKKQESTALKDVKKSIGSKSASKSSPSKDVKSATKSSPSQKAKLASKSSPSKDVKSASKSSTSPKQTSNTHSSMASSKVRSSSAMAATKVSATKAFTRNSKV